MRDRFGGDIAVCTRSVVNHEWIAEALRESLGHDAHTEVGCLAGGKSDDDTYRARRVGLRPCNAQGYGNRSSADGKTKNGSATNPHVPLPNNERSRQSMTSWTSWTRD